MSQSMVVEPMTLKQTVLTPWHEQRGAKMVEFGGWSMPLQYTKVVEEHQAVRHAAGLFDIGHMGLLHLSGMETERILNALNHLVGQDLTRLVPGKAVYTHLLTETAGVVDDIIIYWLPESSLGRDLQQCLVICNASTTDKVIQWLKTNLPQGIVIDWVNQQYALIALQGPQFLSKLKAAPDFDMACLPKRFQMSKAMLWEQPVLLSRTGYTGEDGVEIIGYRQHMELLWRHLVTAGAQPIGLAARDTLRLEAAYPLYGSELSESISPIEAGLGWSIKLQKPTTFLGQAILAQQAQLLQSQDKPQRQLVCFTVDARQIPRHGDVIQTASGSPLGEVTSGSISPTLNKPIGMGFVTVMQSLKPGDLISLNIRGKLIEANVVERPFYKPPTASV